MGKTKIKELQTEIKSLVKANHANVVDYQKVDKENIHLRKLLMEKVAENQKMKERISSLIEENSTLHN